MLEEKKKKYDWLNILCVSSLFFFFRVNDVKTGALIGVDKYGNKYYEDAKNYFFGE